MLYPLQHALKPSRKNLYGVVPPLKDNIESEREALSIDASRKARRVPKIYGKVMFVTKDNDKLRIVNDDGSLGVTFDWGDLNPAWNWMAELS